MLTKKHKPCINCGSKYHLNVLCDPPTPHYGKVICAGCNKRIKWVENPQTDPTRLAQLDRVGEILTCYEDDLTDSEYSFLCSMQTWLESRPLEPHEKEYLDLLEKELEAPREPL